MGVFDMKLTKCILLAATILCGQLSMLNAVDEKSKAVMCVNNSWYTHNVSGWVGQQKLFEQKVYPSSTVELSLSTEQMIQHVEEGDFRYDADFDGKICRLSAVMIAGARKKRCVVTADMIRDLDLDPQQHEVMLVINNVSDDVMFLERRSRQ